MQLFVTVMSNRFMRGPNMLDSFFHLGYVLKEQILKKEVHYA